MSKTKTAILLLLASAGYAFAADPILILDLLAKPLVLPKSLVQTLPINPDASFFGDALRAVDCSSEVAPTFPGGVAGDDVRFGQCGNQLFGGVVMTESSLRGNITIQFFPTSAKTAHFTVNIGVMSGTDGVLAAPVGYSMPNKGNQIADALQLSSGDLDLTTGFVSNLQFYCGFANTALLALGNVNPKLAPPIINFPGIRGHAYAHFAQRKDGYLDFYFRGSTFLALGADVQGDPVRFPLPFCSATGDCASILARGTSLHPHLYLDTRDSIVGKPCAPNCPTIPSNTIQVFNVHSRYTSFGDDFDLKIPEQGGSAPGRSELQGRLEVQFGTKVGNFVPFKVSAMPPEGLFADPPNSPLLGAGFRGFLLGPNQRLNFPLLAYDQHKLLFVDEPYNFATGIIDVRTGQTVGDFEYPMYIDQSIIEALIPANNGRISTDPFFVISMAAPQNPTDPNYAFFEKEPDGSTMFRANLFHRRSFAGFCFPQPSLLPGRCWNSPDGADLNIFVKMQAAHLADPANPGSAIMTDNRTFTSSIGDSFSYNLAAPCDAVGRTVSFVYRNGNSGPSGGTFTMTHPASVSCTNSKVSTAAPGTYDQVSITGFGTWSKDAAGALPRFMTASVSTDPANPYGAILVFQQYPGESKTLAGALILPGDDIDVILSSAENKPATKPIP